MLRKETLTSRLEPGCSRATSAHPAAHPCSVPCSCPSFPSLLSFLCSGQGHRSLGQCYWDFHPFWGEAVALICTLCATCAVPGRVFPSEQLVAENRVPLNATSGICLLLFTRLCQNTLNDREMGMLSSRSYSRSKPRAG